jgi:hypothetical protein
VRVRSALSLTPGASGVQHEWSGENNRKNPSHSPIPLLVTHAFGPASDQDLSDEPFMAGTRAGAGRVATQVPAK